ncbi:activator of Hsp90 ATPase 1 family protein [Metarhizium brunneum]
MPSIYTEVDINCSPEQVRKTFLDFSSYPSWPTTFIKSIAPVDPNKPIEAGSGLTIELEGMSIKPIVVTNSADEFKWVGKLWNMPGLFTGYHYFKFMPSVKTAGATTFVQGEDFSGILSFLMAEGSRFGSSTKKGFEGFNQDLKKRCESGN